MYNMHVIPLCSVSLWFGTGQYFPVIHRHRTNSTTDSFNEAIMTIIGEYITQVQIDQSTITTADKTKLLTYLMGYTLSDLIRGKQKQEHLSRVTIITMRSHKRHGVLIHSKLDNLFNSLFRLLVKTNNNDPLSGHLDPRYKGRVMPMKSSWMHVSRISTCWGYIMALRFLIRFSDHDAAIN